jgi:hypothetical protein
VKSGVIAPVLVVAETCTSRNPETGAGIGASIAVGTAESAAMTSMVEVLGTRVVDAMTRSVGIEISVMMAVGAVVEKESGRVKDRWAAQVAGSSPCVGGG